MSKFLFTIILILLFSAFALLLPINALALWTPGQPIVPDDCYMPSFPCGWSEVKLTACNIFDFFMWLAIAASAIAIAWAGLLYITAGGNEGQVKRAHEVFKKVLIGLAVVILAQVIVSIIVDTIAGTDFSLFGELKTAGCL